MILFWIGKNPQLHYLNCRVYNVDMSLKKKTIIGVIVVCALVICVGIVWYRLSGKDNNAASQQSLATPPAASAGNPSNTESTPSAEKPVTPSTPTPPAAAQTPPVAATPPAQTPVTPQWPVVINLTDAATITVVVNKKHKLSDTYVPTGLVSVSGGQLRSPAADALNSMLSAASANGHTLKIISSYRSYASQKSIYNNYVAQYGQAQADTFSARPGHSEHQTGLTVDVGNGTCDLEICFGDAPAGKWIAANAQNYGFIVRYPQGKEVQTGYQYEPWHLRYLGVDVAQSVYASGKTLDQYYNVPAGGYE